MPQLSQIGEIYASQAFWLAIVFALIYWGIGKAMVPKIEATIDDRARRISGDLAAAHAAREAARDAEEAYQAGLDAARSRAMKAVGEAQAAAASAAERQAHDSDAKTAERLHEATRRIEAGKRDAMHGIEGDTAEAVRAIVAKLAGVEVSEADALGKVKAELVHG